MPYQYPIYNPCDFPIQEEISVISLIGYVNNGQAQADGIDSNIIIYTLWNNNFNVPLPGRTILFNSSSPNAILNPINPITDLNGQSILHITSLVPEEVTISAYLEGDSTVDNHLIIVFRPVVTHRIIARPIYNSVPAGSPHSVSYTLQTLVGAVVPGALMSFNAIDGAVNPGIGFTDDDGEIVVTVNRATAGRVQLNADYAEGNAESSIFLYFD